MRKESFLPEGFISCPKNKLVMADFSYSKQIMTIGSKFASYSVLFNSSLVIIRDKKATFLNLHQCYLSTHPYGIRYETKTIQFKKFLEFLAGKFYF